ncbi:MAG: hypothetical protein U0136_17495 [Bdellovibrionota bacterium]
MNSLDSTNLNAPQPTTTSSPLVLASSHSLLLFPTTAESERNVSSEPAAPPSVATRGSRANTSLHPLCELSSTPPASTDPTDNRLSALTALLTKLSDVIAKLTEALKAAQPAAPKPEAVPPASGGTSTTGSSVPASGSTSTEETEPDSETPDTSSAKLPFAEKERSVLKPDANHKVSEVELRRGIVVFQLYQKDAKLADEFQSAYETAKTAGQTSTNAVKTALLQLVDQKKLSKADANWVYSLSARAAQFEGSEAALSTTTTGSHGLEVGAAIQLAERTLAGIQSGAVAVKPLTIS